MKVLKETVEYENEYMVVTNRKVRLENGLIRDGQYAVIVSDAVGTVVVNQYEEILLVGAYRHINNNISWEIPAGSIDAGEQPKQAAQRELMEEAGVPIAFDDLHPLIYYYPSNGVLNQAFTIFVGRTVIEKEQSVEIDVTEISTLQWFTQNQVKDMIIMGIIDDGPTLTGLLRYFLNV